MPTPTKGNRLGGSPAHERAMLNNLAAQLFENKSVKTTETKAKRLRPHAERLITFAKKGDLASRRRVLRSISDKGIVHELFTSIAPAVAERPGGYTRITKIGNRSGDNAPMAVIELVRENTASTEATRATRAAASKKAAADKATAPAEAENVVEAVTDEATPAEVENAEAVAEAVDDESTAATAPEAEAANADVDGDKADGDKADDK